MARINRLVLLVFALGCGMVISACATSSSATRTVRSASHTYRDPAGWVIEVPAGWHVIEFKDSRGGATAAGALISNVPLPKPSVVPGYPIQVNDRALPGRGIGLIISTDHDAKLPPGKLATPPLSSPGSSASPWSVGSAPAGEPYLETLWLRSDGGPLIASAKVGPDASGGDLHALAQIIISFHQPPISPRSTFRCLPSPLHLNQSRVAAGNSLNVSSQGFACGSRYPAGHQYVLSLGQVGRAAPLRLGAFPVNRNGTFHAVVRIPPNASPGESYIIVSGSPFDHCTDNAYSASSCAGYHAQVQVLPRT